MDGRVDHGGDSPARAWLPRLRENISGQRLPGSWAAEAVVLQRGRPTLRVPPHSLHDLVKAGPHWDTVIRINIAAVFLPVVTSSTHLIQTAERLTAFMAVRAIKPVEVAKFPGITTSKLGNWLGGRNYPDE